MAPLSEKELLGRCFAGKAEAWSEFVARYSGPIHGAICAVLRRYAPEKLAPDRRQDFFQQAFLALCENNCRRLRTFTGENGCSMSTWLRVVVSRLVIDELRRQDPPSLPLDPAPDGRDRAAGPSADPADQTPLPPEQLETEQTIDFLRRQLEELDPRERLIMQLRFVDGLSGERTAEVVGLSRNNVDQIVHRVKERLRQRALAQGFM